MKGCTIWQDAVADCALGVVQDPAFAAHVDRCPGCAHALCEGRVAVARMNVALERRAAAEPPSYGPDRVMARIGGWNPVSTSLRWRWALGLALVGCALAVAIASVLWTRRPTPQPNVSALVSWHSPTDALLQPPVGMAWITMPRLGEGFFELKPSGERHAQ